MVDSVKGKQKKSSLNDVGKITPKHDKQGESNIINPSLNLSQKELKKPEDSNSLDDLLRFDAQVFASSSAGEAEINNDNELSEGLEKKQCESKIETTEDDRETSKCVNEIEQAAQKFVDEDPELITSDAEQQNGHIYLELASIQDKRISQLEHELSELKKMSFIGLVLVVLVLIASLWLGVFNISKQIEPDGQGAIELNADVRVSSPASDSENQIKDDLQIRTKSVENEIKKPEKTLIQPENDIPEVIATDVSAKAKAKEWVVNLNSYEQRRETDNKVEELKKKGIPTETIVVKVKGVRWFRIRVTGFKTKAEAESYAAKIKKTLNNGLAWVSKR